MKTIPTTEKKLSEEGFEPFWYGVDNCALRNKFFVAVRPSKITSPSGLECHDLMFLKPVPKPKKSEDEDAPQFDPLEDEGKKYEILTLREVFNSTRLPVAKLHALHGKGSYEDATVLAGIEDDVWSNMRGVLIQLSIARCAYDRSQEMIGDHTVLVDKTVAYHDAKRTGPASEGPG